MSRPDTILMRLTVAAGRAARDGHDVAQQAVDAVADAQLVGLRLDVHVGGAGAHGVGEHHVDEPDDRRRLDALRRDLLDLAARRRRCPRTSSSTSEESSDSDHERARWSRTWLSSRRGRSSSPRRCRA
jgi:hypothetical protein